MHNSTGSRSQLGFTKIFIALAVITIIAGTSVLAYQLRTKAAVGQQTYTSAIGGFSFTYPVGWNVAEGPAGMDDAIMIKPPGTSSTPNNQFLMTLLVARNPDVSGPPAAIADGTTAKLTNGINVWVSTSASAVRAGASQGRTVCPEVEITNADRTHLSYALPNGLNLAVIAGYCEGQNNTTSLTYQQQLAQGDWQAAASIIKSIQFN